MFEVRHYITDDGHDIFASWHEALKDMRAKIAVERRIQRVELGNFGDCKHAGKACGSFALMWAPVGACITHGLERPLSCCYAAVINIRRTLILRGHVNTGNTGSTETRTRSGNDE